MLYIGTGGLATGTLRTTTAVSGDNPPTISDVKADLRSLRMSKEQTAANIYSCSGKQAKEERREQQQQNKQMQLTTQALCMALMSKLLNDPEVMCSLKRSLSDDKNPPD